MEYHADKALRIIGGKHKGRKIATLRGIQIRPTADPIRESIFNILALRVDHAVVLDLYAGTGAMGLEALSRGAEQALFIDRSPKALNVIRKNIRSLNAGTQAKIIKWDISDNLNCLRERSPTRIFPNNHKTAETERLLFDLIFIDPPYNRSLVFKTLNHLEAIDSLGKDALIVAEHSQSEPIPEDLKAFALTDQRRYGQTVVSFLKYVK